ncbi:glycosyltransferase family 39 protein [Streptomyces albulus]|nr:glycosyltransferase family 39 protein [Streptomyces noursei]
MATTVLDRTTPTGAAPRRAPWRSPVGQPAYARPALLVLAVLAAVLYAWGINHSQYHTFYANAARSMTESWKAFFYGSFDPGNSITLDKLPGFLWPQALSARIFGFHPWALTLPQVLEGVASLLVLYRVVRRWAGDHAALIAGGAFLLTPVAVGLFRTSVEDPLFTLCVLLAAEATQRAAAAGRLGPLVLAGVWVGIGFQSKMLEAWAVLPALALVYLLSAPVALRRRLAHLALSALVMTAVSASWMVAVALTPAQDRPYVDGTTNNSAFSMVVGYNFLNRFSSLGVSAASTGSISATRGGGATAAARTTAAAAPARRRPSGRSAPRPGPRRPRAPQQITGSGTSHAPAGRHPATAALPRHTARGGGPGGFGGGSQDGWGKMFGPSLASQTGWLYPFAAIAVVCGLLWRRGRPRTDRIRAGFALWGTWLATYFLVFSAGSVGGHTYYMGVIAVPLAALTGGGTVALWRAYRAGGRRSWVLPGVVAATAAWGAFLASEFPTFLPWLAPAVGALGWPPSPCWSSPAPAAPDRRTPRTGRSRSLARRPAPRAGRLGGPGLQPRVRQFRHGRGRPVRHARRTRRPRLVEVAGQRTRQGRLRRLHRPTQRRTARVARLHHRPPRHVPLRLRHRRLERRVPLHPRDRRPRPGARRLQRPGPVPHRAPVPTPGGHGRGPLRPPRDGPRRRHPVRRRQRDDRRPDRRLGAHRLPPRPGLGLRRPARAKARPTGPGRHRPDPLPVRPRHRRRVGRKPGPAPAARRGGGPQRTAVAGAVPRHGPSDTR